MLRLGRIAEIVDLPLTRADARLPRRVARHGLVGPREHLKRLGTAPSIQPLRGATGLAAGFQAGINRGTTPDYAAVLGSVLLLELLGSRSPTGWLIRISSGHWLVYHHQSCECVNFITPWRFTHRTPSGEGVKLGGQESNLRGSDSESEWDASNPPPISLSTLLRVFLA